MSAGWGCASSSRPWLRQPGLPRRPTRAAVRIGDSWQRSRVSSGPSHQPDPTGAVQGRIALRKARPRSATASGPNTGRSSLRASAGSRGRRALTYVSADDFRVELVGSPAEARGDGPAERLPSSNRDDHHEHEDDHVFDGVQTRLVLNELRSLEPSAGLCEIRHGSFLSERYRRAARYVLGNSFGTVRGTVVRESAGS